MSTPLFGFISMIQIDIIYFRYEVQLGSPTIETNIEIGINSLFGFLTGKEASTKFIEYYSDDIEPEFSNEML